MKTVSKLMLVGVAMAVATVSAAAQTPTKSAPAKGTTQPAAKAAPKKATPAPAAPAAKSTTSKAALRNPAGLTAVAPATYRAVFTTSAGEFVILVHRDWAPKGADRFYNLVKNGYYDDCRFFRVMSNFMVQFGINGDPSIQRGWMNANITDDPVKQSNKRGYISFATRGPDTRTTQVFINFKDNAGLDGQGFAPFGEVVSGMEIVDKINSKHGQDPDQQRIQGEGNRYLNQAFPDLDYVKTATIAAAAPADKAAPGKAAPKK